jgi:hypothetical protein
VPYVVDGGGGSAITAGGAFGFLGRLAKVKLLFVTLKY